MAKRYAVTTEGEEALTTALETLLQVRGSASIKARVIEWGVFFDSTSVTAEPARVRLLRQTTDGTGTGATEALEDPDDPAALLTGFHTFTAEPTPGEVLREMHVHPQGGFSQQFPLGREPIIDSVATSRVAIDVLPPAAVNATAYMIIEE